MARKTDKAQNEEAKASHGRAHAPGQQKLHQLVGPGGDIIEATQADFHEKYQGLGYIRAGDVAQDHLEDAPADEPKPEPAEVEVGGEADAPDQLPIETEPPAGAQPTGHQAESDAK